MKFGRKAGIKYLVVGILFIGLVSGVYIFSLNSYLEPVPEIAIHPIDIGEISEKSSIGLKEDVAARVAYETRMLIDPTTGVIPEDIRKKELRFIRNLPIRGNSTSLQRTNKKAQLSENDWVSIGPFSIGGRTRALAFDIRDNKLIIAGGVSGGMWRSENLGSIWTKVTKPEDLHSVSSLVQNTKPGFEDTWYYGTGELVGNSARGGGGATYRGDGIFKSTDNGLTWSLLPATSGGESNIFSDPFQFVWNIVINPDQGSQGTIYAATIGGIQRSDDGGATWDFVIGKAANENSIYCDVDINPDGIMFATLSQSSFDSTSVTKGLYRSVNGQDWVDITPDGFPTTYDRVVVTTSPSNPDIAYFLADSDPNDLWKYTYLSGDGSGVGGQWSDLTNNIPAFGGKVGDFESQGSYNMMLKIHPEDENMVFLGGTNLYRSSDGFMTADNTSWIGGYANQEDSIDDYPGHHPDQHILVFQPGESNVVVSGHDGGVSISGNILAQTVTWTSLNNGYQTSQYYSIAISEQVGSNFMAGGLQDNGTKYTYTTQSNGLWGEIIGGDGGFTAITHQGRNVYATQQNGLMYRFSRQGNNKPEPLARIDPVGAGSLVNQEYLFINPFVVDPINNSKIYLAGGDKIWRNNNVTQIAGTTDSTAINWFDLPETHIETGQISALAISRDPKNILYFGSTDGKLVKVLNADSYSPTVIPLNDAVLPSAGYVACIDIDPTNADKFIVAYSNYNILSVFYSGDGGNTFTSISGNLEESENGEGNGPSVRWVKIIPMINNDYLYLAATSAGLYSTDQLDGDDTSWAQEGVDEIGNVVVPMVQYRHGDGRVVIATHGNGIFTKTFENILPLTTEDPEFQFSILQNYPNPFRDFTTIKFSLPLESVARIQIFNDQGAKIRTLLLATQYKGENEVIWDGKDGNGAKVADGIYHCRLQYGNATFNKQPLSLKMILIR